MISYVVLAAAASLVFPISGLFAATISGSVSCSVPGQTVTVASPGVCSADSFDGVNLVTLSSAVASTTTSNFQGLLQADVSVLVNAFGAVPVTASAEITETFSVVTSGPIRPGYLLVVPLVFGNGTGAVMGPGFSFPFGPGYCLNTCPEPITLGTTFEIELYASASLSVDSPDPLGANVVSQVGVDFAVVESDKITPAPYVIAADAPEPASLALGGLAFFLLAVARYSRLIKLAT